MDLDLQRLRDADLDLDTGGTGSGPAGKSSLTSRLTPAPQIVFRVSDPETARALGEAMGGRGRIHRAAERDENGVATGADAAVARAATSSGQALPTHLQRQFEQSTGADLSGVRVHTGGESATAAHAVGAKAYTVGQDIHFAAGRYQPDDPFGMHLLAHEVAHTVQQQGGTAHRQHKLEVSTPHDAAEVEADRAADAMVRGEATAIGGATGLARQVVQRDSDGSGGAGGGSGSDGAHGSDGGSNSQESPHEVEVADPSVPEGSMNVQPPAALNWGGIAPVQATPSGDWSSSPSYDGDFAKPGNLDQYRAAFNASWSAGQGAFNQIVKMSSVIRSTEGELPPILDLANPDHKVGAEKAHADATQSFQGDKVAPGAAKVDSSKVPEETRGKILDLKDQLETQKGTVTTTALDVANSGDSLEKAKGALDKAKNDLKITTTDAQIEKLGLDKAQIERDLEVTKADIAAAAETVKSVISVVKAFKDPTAIFDAATQVTDGIAAINEDIAIRSATTKLNAIDGKVAKLNATKATLNETNASIAIDAAKLDINIAKREVTKALIAHKAAVTALKATYRSLADEMKKAGAASNMDAKDQAKLAAAVEAIPKIEKIIGFCGKMAAGIPAPAYNESAGIGAAMATNYCEFAANIAIVKGTGDYVSGTKATWEARLASLNAVINSATAV